MKDTNMTLVPSYGAVLDPRVADSFRLGKESRQLGHSLQGYTNKPTSFTDTLVRTVLQGPI
uniref:Uncharacterized protein n=1 Tax=Anguilla anguilla TaxID=7936 RepID=A0A0E9VX95_ANGAN